MRLEIALGVLVLIVLAAFLPFHQGVGVSESGPALAALRGLPIDDFFDASYREILLRDPEGVTSMGLAEKFGARNDRLTPVSRDYVAETYDLYREILALLRTYDRSALKESDRLSYDVYEWILDDRLRGEPYAFHSYPITSLALEGWSADVTLVTLFTTNQPLQSKADLDDYLSRLRQVRGKVSDLIETLRWREEHGIRPAQFTADVAVERLRSYLGLSDTMPSDRNQIPVEGTVLWGSFEERLAGIEGLSERERDKARANVRTAIAESFVPAYYDLLRHMEEVRETAPEVGGATALPDGVGYYAYMLRNQTTLNLTPDDVRALGLAEVKSTQDALRAAYAELGYPSDGSLLTLRRRAFSQAPAEDLSTPAAQNAWLERNRSVIAAASEAVAKICDLKPALPLDVRLAPAGSGWNYFTPGSLDGKRPGVYYVNVEEGVGELGSLPAVAYHEAVPGHYFQAAVAAGLNLPLFRRVEASNAYLEGWALYSEQLADELGLYTTPTEKVVQLDLRLTRGCRALADAGIHGEGWSLHDAAVCFETNRGSPPGQEAAMARYMDLPGQGASYTVGCLKILELRERAQEKLDDRFDLREFHNVVLGNGPVPLSILERLIDEYIAKKLGD